MKNQRHMNKPVGAAALATEGIIVVNIVDVSTNVFAKSDNPFRALSYVL